MTTKEKFEKVLFMLNNPVCFVIEHENSIQMLKLSEITLLNLPCSSAAWVTIHRLEKCGAQSRAVV
jgi:hypothetical protein